MTVEWSLRRGNNRWLGWNTDFKYHSKVTHFRWKIKWRLERLSALEIMGERPLLINKSVCLFDSHIFVAGSTSCLRLSLRLRWWQTLTALYSLKSALVRNVPHVNPFSLTSARSRNCVSVPAMFHPIIIFSVAS